MADPVGCSQAVESGSALPWYKVQPACKRKQGAMGGLVL